MEEMTCLNWSEKKILPVCGEVRMWATDTGPSPDVLTSTVRAMPASGPEVTNFSKLC